VEVGLKNLRDALARRPGAAANDLIGFGDPDFEAGVVVVRGKGRRERLAPIGSYADKAIIRYMAVRSLADDEDQGPGAPVFVNRFGRRITTRSIGRMLEKHI